MADEDKLRQYLRKVTAELQQARRRLRTVESQAREPVAVVGMACRYPGGIRSPQDLWEFVVREGDAIAPPPTNRGWEAYGPLHGLAGGFLADPGLFDPEFFGITPDEALAMDPQQRLLLETAWEAFESAGVVPGAGPAAGTAVYAGLSWTGYLLHLRSAPPQHVQEHLALGNAIGAASGRISYALGLLGAAVSVDTGCSSSLVATHLATQALRRGECDLALAGGVSVIPVPHTLLDFRGRGTLAADGRSKSFAAAADGVSLGEGAGMLLLERLRDARRHGHPVLAVIAGSAINQDGASNGMESPSGSAQDRLIRRALADARLSTDQVDAVEGHGIGATLGDPIEAQALISTYGRDRPADRPLWLGSIKSNIGHPQAAGAVAGVIKLIMALRHARLPKTLHVDRATEHVDWSAGTVRLLTRPRPWPPADGRPRRAGVSCFTVTGTNAHLILQEAPELPGEAGSDGPAAVPLPESSGAVPWLLSAGTPAALREQAVRLRALVKGSPEAGPSAADVGHSLATTRATFRHRAVIVGETRDEFLAGLATVAGDEATPGDEAVHRGGAALGDEATPGNKATPRDKEAHRDGAPRGGEATPGHQATAGVALGAAEPRGRTALLFSGVTAFPAATDEEDRQGRLRTSFPLFADTLDEVRGLLSAHIGPPAGASSPETALFARQTALYRLVRAFGVHPDHVIGEGAGAVAAACAAGALSMADACALLAARERLRLGEDLADFRSGFKALDFGPPAIPMAVDVAELSSPEYWIERVGDPGHLAEGIRRLGAAGVNRWLELGPDDTRAGIVQRSLLGSGRPGSPLVLASAARPGVAETRALLAALGELHAHGVAIDWTPAFEQRPARTVPLPTYPFQRRRFWLGTDPATATATPPPPSGAVHPVLGAPLDLAGGAERRFANTIHGRGPVSPNRILGTPVLSAATLLEWLLAAARQVGGRTEWTLNRVSFDGPVRVPDGGLTIQTTIRLDKDRIRVRCHCRSAGVPGAWDEPVTAAAVTASAAPHPMRTDLDALRERLDPGEPEAFYDRLWRQGLECDPPDRGLTRLWYGDDEALGLVEIAGENPDAYLLHPAALEGCLRLPAVFAGSLQVPAALDRLSVYDRLPGRAWCHAARRPDQAIDIAVYAESGRPVAVIEGLRMRAVPGATMAGLAAAPPRRHELRWKPLPQDTAHTTIGARAGHTLVCCGDAGQARRWRDELTALGLPAVAVITDAGPDSPGEYHVDADDEAAVRRLFAGLADGGIDVGGLVLYPGPTATDQSGDGPLRATYRLGVRAALLLKHFLREHAASGPEIVVCSTGAAVPRPGDRPPDLAQTMLTALAKAVVHEHPEVGCVQVDLDPAAPPPALATVLGRRSRLAGAGHLALRGGRWYEARLREADPPSPGRADPVPLRGGCTYLIDGGSAQIAGALAQRLSGLGARSLLLTGRPAEDGEPAQLAGLRAGGVDVLVRDAVPDDVPAVGGVIHLADPEPGGQPLAELDAASFRRSLDRRIRAIWRLHRMLDDPDLFVVSPDIAALIGAPGQVATLATGAFLEALAHHHPAGHSLARGTPAASRAGSLARIGIRAVETERLVDELMRPPEIPGSADGLAHLDRARFLGALRGGRPYTLLDAMGADPAECAEHAPGFGQRRMNANRAP